MTTKQSMMAAVLDGPTRFAVRAAPRPEPGSGEVRLRVEGSGVCASSLPAFEGRPWFDYPMPAGELGHEGWGVVDALGPDVTSLVPGQRVAFVSYRAYAAYDIASASLCVPLPKALDGMPFPGEALGCIMNIFRRAGVRAGHRVAVVGVGFLGAGVIQLAVAAGATVIALGRSEASLALAASLGAAETVRLDDHERVLARMASLTDGHFCDVVFECTGKPWPLDVAGECTGVRGRLVIAGFHQDGMRQVNVQLWNWRGIDIVNAHERDPAVVAEGIRLAIDAVLEKRLDLDALVTHRVPLHGIGQALAMLRDREPGLVKCVVDMEVAS